LDARQCGNPVPESGARLPLRVGREVLNGLRCPTLTLRTISGLGVPEALRFTERLLNFLESIEARQTHIRQVSFIQSL
jgi:hypothetical protein